MGHGFVLHFTCWVLGHSLPPLDASFVILYVWVCVPSLLPHSPIHGPSFIHSPSQSTLGTSGQSFNLHRTCLVCITGHAFPPLDASLVILYVWVCVPSPHSLEQVPVFFHSPLQSIEGHACLLQSFFASGTLLMIAIRSEGDW